MSGKQGLENRAIIGLTGHRGVWEDGDDEVDNWDSRKMEEEKESVRTTKIEESRCQEKSKQSNVWTIKCTWMQASSGPKQEQSNLGKANAHVRGRS